MSRQALILLIVGAGLASPTFAQCGPAEWHSANAYPGPNGSTQCSTLWDPDGAGPLEPALTVGGNFTIAGSELANSVAWWDGSAWHGIGTNQLTGNVTALATWNGALVAGNSTFAGSGVVIWNGSSWGPLGTGTNSVSTALLEYGGELYSGRAQSGMPSLVKWDGASWQAVPTGVVAGVYALTLHNGALIAGGGSTLGTGAVGSWNGTTWSNVGQTFNMVVRSVCSFGGALCAGGEFLLAGSTPAHHVARWDGSGWQSLGLGTGSTGLTYALAEWNGMLIASSLTGTFGSPYSVTAWDETSWQTLGVAGIGAVKAVAAFGADLYAMGDVNTFGGVFTGSVARWNGAAWATSTAAGLDSEVLALTTWKGDLVAGGTFRTASVANTNGIARFDGLAWHALGTGMSGQGGPRIGALATYNGDLIAAGLFSLAGGVAVANIARWDGTSWYALGPGLVGMSSPSSEEPHRIVRQLAVYNGELYAAGYLTGTGSGTPLGFIGRWNGSTWQAVGTGTNGPIHALCIYNGELYAGGGFSSAGGVGVANVARWNGSSWQSAGGAGPAGTVHALVVHDGGLYAGGQFVTCAGQAVNGIARWDGVAWSAPPPVGNNAVKALASYDGDLVAASVNWALPTGFTSGLARLSGGSWTSLGSGLTILQNQTTDGVRVLAVHQGALFAGGWFSTAGGVGSPLLARWSRPLPWVSAAQTTSGSVRIRDAWLVPGHEYYNLASLDLCPAGPGTGPWGGLCANDVNVLWQQVALPLGTTPFHFAATATTANFGPFTLPPGLAFELISIDLTGGVVGCISTAVRYTVY